MKGLCDAIFEKDLELAAESTSVNIISPIMRAVVEKALKEVANIYVDFVIKSEAGHDAYCGIAANASSRTCSGSAYTGGGYNYNMLSTDSGYANYSYYFHNLWYRCYSYRVTYSDGTQSYLEQCDLTY